MLLNLTFDDSNNKIDRSVLLSKLIQACSETVVSVKCDFYCPSTQLIIL